MKTALAAAYPLLIKEKKWRPTAFAIVQNHKGFFGAGLQNTREKEWGFVQGVYEEPDNNPENTILRELWEEVGLARDSIESISLVYQGRFVGTRDEAFSKGGHYAGYHVRLNPGVDIDVSAYQGDRQPILEWRWRTSEQLCRLFIDQPGTHATVRTREKGRTIFCPALRELALLGRLDLLD